MDLDRLQRKLIAAARAHSPSSAVSYAFERRITAHIKSLGHVDYWAFWGRALWRASAPCVALTLLLVAWALFTGPGKSASTDLSQDLENTVLAAAYLDQPATDSVR